MDPSSISDVLKKSVTFALNELTYDYSSHTGEDKAFIEVKPDSCSISLLGNISEHFEIVNGGLSQRDNIIAASMRVSLGIERNVVSKRNFALAEISLLSPHTLFSSIKRFLLIYYPILAKSYIGSERKDNSNYYLAPKDDVVYIQEKPVTQEVTGEFLDYLIALSDEIYQMEFILSCKIEFTNICKVEFFVDQNSEIVQYKPIIQIAISVDYINQSNHIILVETVEYFSTMPTYEDIEKVKARCIKEIKTNNIFYPIRSGAYPVLLKSDASDVFFHEALAAHLLSATYVMSDYSTIFKGRIGEVIPYLKGIDVIMDPEMEDGFGSYLYDHEGCKSQKLYLIKDGKILNYLTDRRSSAQIQQNKKDEELINQIVPILEKNPELLEQHVDAKHLTRRSISLSGKIKYLLKSYLLDSLIKNLEVNQNLNWRYDFKNLTEKSNGHSRVQSWAILNEDGEVEIISSEARMSNLLIETSSNYSQEDLENKVKSICFENNIDFYLEVHAKEGHVEIETGLFVIQPNELFKVYMDGRREPVNPGTFSLNLEDFLTKIAMIGSEVENNKGFCGSTSGFVPVGSKTPGMVLTAIPYQEAPEGETASDEICSFLNHKW